MIIIMGCHLTLYKHHHHSHPYIIFVILLTPAPFSTDIKNTLIPDFLTPKKHKIHDFHTKNTLIYIF